MRLLIFCTFVFTLPFFSNGFWILSHSPLVTERLDPIVSGQNFSGHVHTFVGDSDILGNQQNTSCTTSVVKDDRSRYWAPQLYYYAKSNKTFSSVPLQFVNTYYLNRGGPSMGANPKLTAFPNGFKMIAGNASQFDGPLSDATAASAINFECLDYTKGSKLTNTIPKGPCPQGLRTQIVFPSCWDGINLDSKDHQSHVSYPTGQFSDYGDCPSSHPVKFITLFYEFIYDTKQLHKGKGGTLVLANGDTIGWSFHADFISGWNVDTLQAGINQCTSDLFGAVEKCAPFVQSLDRSATCSVDPVMNEKVLGSMKTLPGCNAIKNGRFKNAGTCKIAHKKKNRKSMRKATKPIF